MSNSSLKKEEFNLLTDPAELREKLSQEIAARKKIEQALKKSDNNLKDTQEVAKIGSWNWDIKTRKVTWSAELYKLLADLDLALPKLLKGGRRSEEKNP